MGLLSKVLQAILEVTLPILVSALTVWAIGKAKEIFMKLKEESPGTYYQVVEIVKTLVNAAEQIYNGPGRGKEKKEYVIKLAQKWLISKGLNIDVEIIAAAIEAEVFSLNSYKQNAEETYNEIIPTAVSE